MAAASMSMKINDTESDRRPLYLFDDENRAKVRRPIGAIDHDGWTYLCLLYTSDAADES